MTITPTTERTCQGPGCAESVTSGQARARYCSTRCRKAAARQRERGGRPPRRRNPAAKTTTSTPAPPATTTTVAADRAALGALGKGGHDPRSATEYARALATETERSLRQDGSRWRWTRSRESIHGRGAATAVQERRRAAGGTPGRSQP